MAPSISQASEFFDALPVEDQKAFEYLSSFVKVGNPLKEADWLEYKSGFYEKEKVAEHWSKHLSGFANSGSGVLVWGIQTKAIDGHDVPDCIVLVEKPEEFKGNLEELRRHIVDPPVRGVKIRSITGEAGKGFVVALIPESELRPHQAKHEQCKNNYYFRNGHSTEPVKQSLLRILFYPQSNALMSLRVMAQEGTPTTGYRVRLRLGNIGRTTISDMYLTLFRRGPENVFEPQELNCTIEGPNDKAFVSILVNKSLHPSLNIDVGDITMFDESKIWFGAYARDMTPFHWRVESAGRTGVFNAILDESSKMTW